jgi:cyclic pyranopterin phosphate synthase
VRFIELFPVNIRTNSVTSRIVTNGRVKEEIAAQLGSVVPASGVKGNGPAEYFKLRKSEGVIGFISGSSENFCDKCSRIRVDCMGRVFPCLFSEHICGLNPVLKETGTENNLVDYIKNVLTMKQEYSRNVKNCKNIEMSKIGG